MTLHDTTELVKRAGIGSIIGIVTILLIVIIVRVGIGIKNYLYPPVKDPPTQTYGFLVPLQFPKNTVDQNFTYTLDTTSGDLPTDLPDRLSVFPIVENQPNFLNLGIAKKKIASLNFISEDGKIPTEIKLGDPYYEWDEKSGFNRKIIMNINSFDFKMTSDFLSSLTVLSAKFISNESSAINVAEGFLDTAEIIPNDLDLTKTTTKDNPSHYVTYPKLFSIESGVQGNTLVQTSSLSRAQVIRVDFYQKDVEYDMNTGYTEGANQKTHIKLPILYPQPPYSIMSFWIASGQGGAMVTQAFYTHKKIDFSKADATYLLKTAEQAYTELKDGKAYIANYWGSDSNIVITDVYLAYYLAEDSIGYMQPIYVFEGKYGFFAYIPALIENISNK